MAISFPEYNVRIEQQDKTYTRMFAAGVYYNYEEIPSINFCREDITITSSGKILKENLSPQKLDASDISKTFPVLNPMTGETSQMSYGEFMWIFGQLWLHSEVINAPVVPPVEEPIVDPVSEPEIPPVVDPIVDPIVEPIVTDPVV